MNELYTYWSRFMVDASIDYKNSITCSVAQSKFGNWESFFSRYGHIVFRSGNQQVVNCQLGHLEWYF